MPELVLLPSDDTGHDEPELRNFAIYNEAGDLLYHIRDFVPADDAADLRSLARSLTRILQPLI